MRREAQEAPTGFLSVREFAAELGVQRSTVLRWIREGRLPSVKIGRTILVPEDALAQMVRSPKGDPS